MKGEVLFLDKVHPMVRKGVEDLGYTFIDGHQLQAEDLEPYLRTVIGIIVRHRIQLNEALLSKAPLLQWIGRSGVGLDAIDTAYCTSKGIAVVNGAGGNANAVGEHVIGMLLSLLNNSFRADQEVRQGVWKREANRGLELGARTIGVIGYGNTGRALAEKLSGFGTNVLAHDKYRTVDGPFAKKASLKEIQESCDIISFHVPLNEETKHYFNTDFLERMKHPFYLINAARGPVCDLSAIATGIKNNRIIGAGIDVLPSEPKDEGNLIIEDESLSELINSDKVIFSPHIAGWTSESYENLARVLVDRIKEIDAA
jgi:D-3-phosphoglycerate dehydrogenase